MQKFNGFENFFIKTSVKEAVKKAEADIISLEGEGKRSIYAPGYLTMVGNELLDKIDSMTLKKALKDGK